MSTPTEADLDAMLERSARNTSRAVEVGLITALLGVRATIARVEALHYPQNNGVKWLCYECGSPWPCRTVAALAPKETP